MENNERLYDAKDHLVAQNVHQMTCDIITQAYHKGNKRSSSRALLAFVCRNAGSWESLRTLLSSCGDTERMKAIALDCGAILRCMYDAYLQALFVWEDPNSRDDRGSLYLDYAHVERHKLSQDALRQDDSLSRYLAASPLRTESEDKVRQNYEQVKDRYLNSKRKGVRDHWYPHDNLRTLARCVGKESEYVWLVKMMNGSVHTGPFAMFNGPPLPGSGTLYIANKILSNTIGFLVDNECIVLDSGVRELLNACRGPLVGHAVPLNRRSDGHANH